jgi:hypothetical protein
MNHHTKRRSKMLNYNRSILLAAAAGLQWQAVPSSAAQLEDTSKIIAAQLHKQGVACTMARDAVRKDVDSGPNVSVWIVSCDEATYRVQLIPRRQALITPIAREAANAGAGEGTEGRKSSAGKPSSN